MELENIVKIAGMGIRSKAWKHLLLRSPRRLKNLALGDSSSGDPASMIQVEITSRCNFACNYCTQHAGKSRGQLSREDTPSGDMSLEMFKSILDKHPYAAYLQLQGQGEPLLHSQIDEFIKEAKNRGLYVLTISNGSLLCGERANALLDSGLDNYVVSLDVSTPSEMQELRKGLKYQSVVRKVNRFIQERNRRKSKTLIGISSVVTRDNMALIPEVVRKYDSEIGPDYMVIAPLASLDGSGIDYMSLYTSKIRDQVIGTPLILPEMPRTDMMVKTCSDINYSGKVCQQTRAVYYRFDGSTAYCANRHKVDCQNPEETMRQAAKQMKEDIVPSGCSGCHYLPRRLCTREYKP